MDYGNFLDDPVTIDVDFSRSTELIWYYIWWNEYVEFIEEVCPFVGICCEIADERFYRKIGMKEL